jgi:hypothetical protein
LMYIWIATITIPLTNVMYSTEDGVHEVVVFLREAGDLVRPEVLGAEGMVRVALHKEVLEEAHVLEGEEGDLVLGLVDYEGDGRVFAFEAGFGAVAAGGACFLTLGVVWDVGCFER